ncbi:MAG: molybdenum cofactor guanylyltransferase [Planctomycetes bacterium]|nr:molybdenum cofactor guanylyltransferase [Planctomycetota bacterium]
MGTDKALEELAGLRLVEHAVAALGVVAKPVLLATGATPRYTELGLDCVLDGLPKAGPLAGLVAGLAAAQERGAQALVVSACDTPRANAVVFRALLERLNAGSADAVLLRTEDGVEPLIAAYRGTCLEPARAALAQGRRRMTSFHEGLAIDYVEAAGLDVESPATNVNTPEELAAERRYFAASPKERRA